MPTLLVFYGQEELRKSKDQTQESREGFASKDVQKKNDLRPGRLENDAPSSGNVSGAHAYMRLLYELQAQPARAC